MLRKFVFFLLILEISSQEFKQFVFPEHLASALDAASEKPQVLSPRGVVASVSIPDSGELLNDPGIPHSRPAFPQVPYPEPASSSDYGHSAPQESEKNQYPPSQPQSARQTYYSLPNQPQDPYYPPSQPQEPQYPPSQPQEPYYPPSQPQQPYYPPAPTAAPPPGPKEPYEINYCDKSEFPDDHLAEYSLERIEYFIYNKSCSGTFFQCSIGQTYLFNCLSEEQAFDPSIVNCNYKYDNRICPDYDHIVHCTIKETCTENQFACCAEPQKCIDLSRRCDSHPDCSNGEDETNCPSCAKDEFACVKSGKCIPTSKRCDGYADDCGDGSNLDEIGCSKNSTCWGKFVCESPQTIATLGHSECIDYELHCDGQKNCPGGEDEMNCRQTGAKYLLCENQKQSVLKEQWCDGQEHCADGSDERYCY